MAISNRTSDRATFSSVVALISAIALAAFTSTAALELGTLSLSLKLVVAWSYAMCLALIVWACRDWFGIHWIGNPTLSMIAGASGSSIAAVALAFSAAGGSDQDKMASCQLKVSADQLAALQRIEIALTHGIPASSPITAQPVSIPPCVEAVLRSRAK